MTQYQSDSHEAIQKLLSVLGDDHRPTEAERGRTEHRIINELLDPLPVLDDAQPSGEQAELIRVVLEQREERGRSHWLLRIAASFLLVALGSVAWFTTRPEEPKITSERAATDLSFVSDLPGLLQPGLHEVTLANQRIEFMVGEGILLVSRHESFVVLERSDGARFTLAVPDVAFEEMSPEDWLDNAGLVYQVAGAVLQGRVQSSFDVFLSRQDAGADLCATDEPCLPFAEVDGDLDLLSLQLGVANRIAVTRADDGRRVIGFQVSSSGLVDPIVMAIILRSA